MNVRPRLASKDPLAILQRFWGYSEFRPLQREAIQCALDGRDSLTVLPTGGGKSLCYQVPALAMDGMAVVVSPLISLMKDQVDFLEGVGVDAVCLNSTLKGFERREVEERIRAGRVKLLYVAPERLATPSFMGLLREANVSFFAIDEAHDPTTPNCYRSRTTSPARPSMPTPPPPPGRCETTFVNNWVCTNRKFTSAISTGPTFITLPSLWFALCRRC